MYLGLWEQRAVSAIVDFKLQNESDLSMFFVPLQIGRDEESLPYKLWSLQLVYRYECAAIRWVTELWEHWATS